jgi:hypothetical protein
MLNNDKLNKRLKKIFKELKDKWKITFYRIAVESNIPHSSLKYMLDGKFEWKLNHLLSVIDFLNRFGAKISLIDLLNFDKKISPAQIMNTKNADFRKAYRNQYSRAKKPVRIEKKQVDYKTESENLTDEIGEVIKECTLFKNSKILVGLKISGKGYDYKKNINFVNGKVSKS